MGRIKFSMRGRARVGVLAAVMALGALPMAAYTGLLSSSGGITAAGAAGVDSCGYPTTTVLPNGAISFNESGALASTFVTGNSGATQPAIKVVRTTANPQIAVWYTDEWALTLGVDTSVGSLPADDVADGAQKTTTVTDAGVTTFNTTSHRATNPSIGDPETDAQNKPIAPSIFVSPVTAGTLANVPQPGDWQKQANGSAAQFGVHAPNDVFGTWYHADEINTAAPLANTANDPPANGFGWFGQGGSDPITLAKTDKYQAEIRWNTTGTGGLNLAPGVYKVQAIIHDGDHAADTGEACAIVVIPGPPGITSDVKGGTDPAIAASHITVPVGGTIKDTVFLSPTAGLGNVTGNVTMHLYFVPNGTVLGTPTDACTNTYEVNASTNPANATGFPDTEALTVGNPSYATSKERAVGTALGTYYWQSVYAGAGNYLGVTETCGDETVTVAQPRIRLAPYNAENVVGFPHTLTATLDYTTNGTTFTNISGADVAWTLTGSATFVSGNGTPCTTDANGQCSVKITDSVAETVTIHASATGFSAQPTVTGTFGTIATSSHGTCTGAADSATTTCDATKKYVKPTTKMSVIDRLVGLPGSATGTVTYTTYTSQARCVSDTGGASAGGGSVSAGSAGLSNSVDVADGNETWFTATLSDGTTSHTTACVEGVVNNS